VTFDPAYRTRLLTDWEIEGHTVLTDITVLVGESDDPSAVMIDIGCGPCVVSARLAREWGLSPAGDLGFVQISTRLGTFEGLVDRYPIRLRGALDYFEVDCSWLVIDAWPGPPILGWRGCLERFRFAIDPVDNWFYFARPY
jgi:hypothetical protein